MKPLKAEETGKKEKDLLNRMAEEKVYRVRRDSGISNYLTVPNRDNSFICPVTSNLDIDEPDTQSIVIQIPVTPLPTITEAPLLEKTGRNSIDEIKNEKNTKKVGNETSEFDTNAESNEIKTTDSSVSFLSAVKRKIGNSVSSFKRTPETTTPAIVTELHKDIERNSSFLNNERKKSLPKNMSSPLFKTLQHRRNSSSIHRSLTQSTSLAMGTDVHRRSISICSNKPNGAAMNRNIGSSDSLYLRLQDPTGLRRRDLSSQSLRPMYRRDVFYTGSITSLQRNNTCHGSLIEYRASNINLPILDVHDDIAQDLTQEGKGNTSEIC